MLFITNLGRWTALVVFPINKYTVQATQNMQRIVCGAEFTVNRAVLRCSCVKEHSAVLLAFYFKCVCMDLIPQKGYDDLQSIVPTCQQQSDFAMATQKISKATVLQKSENIHYLFIFPCHMSCTLEWKSSAACVCMCVCSNRLHSVSPQRKEEAGRGCFHT